MNNKYFQPLQHGGLSLPESVVTRNGEIFNPREDRWTYRDGGITVSINFSLINNVSDSFLLSLKIVLIWYLENMSPSHAVNMFQGIKYFLDALCKYKILNEISTVDILNFKATCDVRTEWRLSSLAGFFKKWYELEMPGVSKEVIDLLGEMQLKGNIKGEAVLTMDPFKGPFTDIERNALYVKLESSYNAGDVDISDYILCILVLILGQRSIQYSYLKICDVQVETRNDGSKIVILNMPRAKQRGEKPRTSFKARVLIPQIGALLVDYANKTKENFYGILDDPSQGPLFPDIRRDSVYSERLKYHRTRDSIQQHVKKTFDKLNVISERTGAPIDVNTSRFRRTIGTQAAAEGHGPLVIAELLDHSDLQNVGVYVASSPEIIERIDRAVAMRLAPLAQAFSGALVDSVSEHNASPGQKIVAPKFASNFKPVGSCGQFGFCAFAAPIACYTCSNFRAWLDGPHEAILDFLIAERERLMKTDIRIASVNDRTILAVAQVVEMCKESISRQNNYV